MSFTLGKPYEAGIASALDSLKKAIHEVGGLDRSIGQLRAVYTELYVASMLKKFSPQLGYARPVTARTADIYLSTIEKRIEVKADEKGVFSGEADFAWSLGPKQLRDHKFDFCVVVGYSDSLNIEKVFVFSQSDFVGEPIHNPFFIRDLAGVAYGNKYPGETPLERKLHNNPTLFENRWDKIK